MTASDHRVVNWPDYPPEANLRGLLGEKREAMTHPPEGGRPTFAGSRWRHVKSGGIYEIICGASVEATLDAVVVYRNVETGEAWTRPHVEFHDGRFELVSRATAAPPEPSCSACGKPLPKGGCSPATGQCNAAPPEGQPVAPVGFITKEDLAKLLDPEWQARRNDSSVTLWTIDGPPSRAIVPLYTAAQPAPTPEVQPVAYQWQHYIGNPSLGPMFWTEWEFCTKEQYEYALATPDYQARALCDCTTAAQPAAPEAPHSEAYISWDGFNVEGDRKSVSEVRRLVEFEAARRVVPEAPRSDEQSLSVQVEHTPSLHVNPFNAAAQEQSIPARIGRNPDEPEVRPATPVAAAPAQERAAFEAWFATATNCSPNAAVFCRLRSTDEYATDIMQSGWEAWQARAALKRGDQ